MAPLASPLATPMSKALDCSVSFNLCCHERTGCERLNWVCPEAWETRGTPLLEVSFVFCKVVSRLLLQHVTVDENAVW